MSLALNSDAPTLQFGLLSTSWSSTRPDVTLPEEECSQSPYILMLWVFSQKLVPPCWTPKWACIGWIISRQSNPVHVYVHPEIRIVARALPGSPLACSEQDELSFGYPDFSLFCVVCLCCRVLQMLLILQDMLVCGLEYQCQFLPWQSIDCVAQDSSPLSVVVRYQPFSLCHLNDFISPSSFVGSIFQMHVASSLALVGHLHVYVHTVTTMCVCAHTQYMPGRLHITFSPFCAWHHTTQRTQSTDKAKKMHTRSRAMLTFHGNWERKWDKNEPDVLLFLFPD